MSGHNTLFLLPLLFLVPVVVVIVILQPRPSPIIVRQRSPCLAWNKSWRVQCICVCVYFVSCCMSYDGGAAVFDDGVRTV
ncbi:hypothetical protein K439DRAFT_1637724 [Ramaria rubella]|nr:hypothetical protein K439DRAFT_1637724 [Ramaria rubella]